MSRLLQDPNSIAVSGGESSADSSVVLPVKIDSVTGRLLTSTVSVVAVPSSVLNGSVVVTTGGTAVALAVSTTITSVVVKAKYGNTGTIYIGNATVDSSNGVELQAGDAISIDIDDLAKVYVDASVNGEGVDYLATV